MKRFLLIILCICAYFSSLAQCTTVNEDGSVTITCNTVIDAVIERQDGDSWVEIGSLENGTYTDNAANANNQSITYRISASNERPVFSTIHCNVKINENDASKVDIQWTDENYPTAFRVYRKTHSDDGFILIDGSAAAELFFEETKIDDCEILYKIEEFSGDCSSWSNIATLPKTDNDGPLSPVLQPIDVDLQSQKIIVSWQRPESEDLWGYVVCKTDDNGIRQSLDTLYDAETTTYICGKCNILDTNRITVFAFDYCKNSSPLSETYNNIVLRYEREDCSKPLHLTWNTPDDKGDIKQYEVYMATDEDMTYKRIAVLHTLELDTDLPQINGNAYFYVICGGKSNVLKINIAGADTLDFVYLEGVSITEDNMHAEIYAFLDPSKKVSGYKLFRKMDDGEFEDVKFIAYTGESYLKFTDELPLSADEHLYTYFLAAPDVCGGNYTYSNQITAIQLEIDATNQSRIKLTWNPFKPVNWTVSGYEIYRYAENDFANAEYIGKTSANSFTDDIENIVSSTDRTYYYVKAVALSTDGTDILTYGVNSSNAYAKFESILFVPNAFSPKDGRYENLRTFLPACHFVRAGTYSFKVFSRAGQLLFETTDPDKGWDGKYKGEYCPVGSYVYKISFIDSDGMEQNKGGIFLLYD